MEFGSSNRAVVQRHLMNSYRHFRYALLSLKLWSGEKSDDVILFRLPLMNPTTFLCITNSFHSIFSLSRSGWRLLCELLLSVDKFFAFEITGSALYHEKYNIYLYLWSRNTTTFPWTSPPTRREFTPGLRRDDIPRQNTALDDQRRQRRNGHERKKWYKRWLFIRGLKREKRRESGNKNLKYRQK